MIIAVQVLTPANEVKLLTEFELYLFLERTHPRLSEKLGSHLAIQNGIYAAHFAVCAPNARHAYIIGDFNVWEISSNPLSQEASPGVWVGFIPGVSAGAAYKCHLVSWYHAYEVANTAPFTFRQGSRPRRVPLVWILDFEWGEDESRVWRKQHMRLDTSTAIHEVDIGSWMRVPEENNRSLAYREIAPRLSEWVNQLSFTRVQFLPVMGLLQNSGLDSAISWLRLDSQRQEDILALSNFTPILRKNHDVWVPRSNQQMEILNRDAKDCDCTDLGDFDGACTTPFSSRGRHHTLIVTLPPPCSTHFQTQN